GRSRARVCQRRAGSLLPAVSTCRAIFDWRSEHKAAGLAIDANYLLRPDTPTEPATGTVSLIVSSALCDLVRQRQLVGLAQPADHCEGHGCHRHQKEGRCKVIAASLYHVDGDHWGEPSDDPVNEIESHRDDCAAHPTRRHFHHSRWASTVESRNQCRKT